MNQSTDPASSLFDEQATPLLVHLRFRCDDATCASLHGELVDVLDVLADRPGFLAGRVGAAIDDPHLLILSLEWTDVGSYRRAWSDFEVRVAVVPVLSRAHDEPNAFEVFEARGPNPVSARSAREIT